MILICAALVIEWCVVLTRIVPVVGSLFRLLKQDLLL